MVMVQKDNPYIYRTKIIPVGAPIKKASIKYTSRFVIIIIIIIFIEKTFS